ncbi:MAG: hypothetical protein HON53_23155 [Planctomycetaceae bacterium]|jgi:hypothetical protein|nr:hypothetical protein [Planctomycetaceae bacterium]MBT6155669.1 hypothetical protein [Planctomycetaceae bacterium]MBT6486305.1 hypothetical protein [Planctomycetaceae bacterium]MBT6495096.1 hypothetical protein [Planctomycetaceae bacterium]
MSRRTDRNAVGFESDSFLDIIANIVGILIILIVMAGVRVGNAPILPLVDIATPAPIDEQPEIVVVAQLPPEELPTPEEQPLPTVPGPELSPPKPPPPIEPSPELVALVSRLNGEVASLKSDSESSVLLLSQLRQAEEETDQKLRGVAGTLAAESAALDAEKKAVAGLDAELASRRDQVQRLRFQLKQTKDSKPPAKQIRHKLTPIGSTVVGKELHFHVFRNRVSHVPLDDLLGRLRSQVLRQKDWLTKFNTHHGSVGPVAGFTMNYVVVRQRLSVVEELRQGRGMMRIGVSEWQLVPSRDIASETAKEALRPGSAFHRALLAADRNATLTFWVYPDSFEVYRKLQQVAQEEAFTVAARPLPFGIPISGSPNGSRSSGQ